jgi:hypothetical protein
MAWRARSSDAGIRWVYVRNVKPGSWCPRYSANARMLVPCSSCICAIEAAWSVAARSLPCPAPVEAPRHATNLACRGDGASRTAPWRRARGTTNLLLDDQRLTPRPSKNAHRVVVTVASIPYSARSRASSSGSKNCFTTR